MPISTRRSTGKNRLLPYFRVGRVHRRSTGGGTAGSSPPPPTAGILTEAGDNMLAEDDSTLYPE